MTRQVVAGVGLPIIEDDIEGPAVESAGREGTPTAILTNHGTTREEIRGPDDESTFVSRCFPLQSREILKALLAITGGWPKSCRGTLFVPGADGQPRYLGNSTQLMAWVEELAVIRWKRQSLFVPQDRFHEFARNNADRVQVIEALPHFPPVEGAHYLHAALPDAADGSALEGLLDRFSPSTELDRDLIRAAICTPFWGGPPGARPAFLVTSRAGDDQQGRGVGKTTLVDLIAVDLAGGAIDVNTAEDVERIKGRLLTPEAMTRRVCRVDNVKSPRYERAEIEALITSAEISGHRLYQGEAGRPNRMTWFFTVNAAILAKDMAQRVIPIKLSRPEYDAEWLSSTQRYIADRRLDIIADVGRLLMARSRPVHVRSRWADWERGVLAACTDHLERVQRLIARRQGAIDADEEERSTVREAFRGEVRSMDIKSDRSRVFIPAARAAACLNRALGLSLATNRASTHLRQLALPELEKARRGGSNGWYWTCQIVPPSPRR